MITPPAPIVPPLLPGGTGPLGHAPLLLADPVRLLAAALAVPGPAVAVRLPGPAYLLRDPRDLRHILADPVAFPRAGMVPQNRPVFGAGVMLREGAGHRAARALLLPAFHGEALAAMTRTIATRAEALAADWAARAARGDGRVALSRAMAELALTIAAEIFLGLDLAGDAPRLGRAVRQLQLLMFKRATAAELAPSGAATPEDAAYRAAIATMHETIAGAIARRRAAWPAGRSGGGADALDLLLAARDERGATLRPDRLRDELATLILAGHETTATALTWSLLLLADNAPARERLVAEARSAPAVDGPGLLRALPWAEACFLETLRLYPPVYVIQRRPRRDAVLPSGVAVGRGVGLLLAPYLAGRDPATFADATGFLPGRWLPDATPVPASTASFAPFGSGPHRCLGEGLARLEGALILAALARAVRIVPDEPARAVALVTLLPAGPVRATLHPA